MPNQPTNQPTKDLTAADLGEAQADVLGLLAIPALFALLAQ
jgi:hypothetical protein